MNLRSITATALLVCCSAYMAPALAIEPAIAMNPETPHAIDFAGEKIDLRDRDRRERFDRELTAMAFTHGNTLLQIKRSARYFPIMKKVLKDNDIPVDFIYLACIESQLNPRAVSPAKAAGLWQLMPTTAREYGLEVNDNVDERFDPELSTQAACRYLRQARNRFADWMTVAASYNAGMGRIARECEAQSQTSAMRLWLPDETMRYMFRILAAKTLMENPAKYGFRLHGDQYYRPVECRIVEVNTPVDDWMAWALENGTTYYDLRDQNPWIRSRQLPNTSGKTYRVRIPLN